MAAAALVCTLMVACQGPRDRTMNYAAYRAVEHSTPYVLEIEQAGQADSRLVYYGAAHFNTPDDPQAADIERRWAALHPDFALNEGGDPPAEPTREIAIGRHGEPGLLRWLAKRDGVPIRSLDPTRKQEIAALSSRFSMEDLSLFYILRWVMQDGQRAPQFRQVTLEPGVQAHLKRLMMDGATDGPKSLAEFEKSVRRRAPQLTDWRKVPPEWFDPALEPPAAFTNTIARAMSEFRDAFMVDVLETAVREHTRVFAAVGASHVVMQEPELRRRFHSVGGPYGFLMPAPAAGSPPDEIKSFLGMTLVPPPIPEARRQELSRKLVEYTDRAADPAAVEADFIWLGRTLAYLHRYHEAIDAFSRGLEKHPQSYRLLRHRGHRSITIRDLDRAGADLELAASIIESERIPDEIEPDGAPNRSGIPRSTTNTNIYYHLGVVYYLRGDFGRAAGTFHKCLAISPNDDMTVATVHWLYMSLRRAGKDTDARACLNAIGPEMQIIENDAYFRLCRMYQGAMTPEQVLPADESDAIGLASAGYGVANWYWCEGRRDQAISLLERIAASPTWPAFGVIAAEADLRRLQQKP
jgi:tetratricopeptide (TPR) repeat protein